MNLHHDVPPRPRFLPAARVRFLLRTLVQDGHFRHKVALRLAQEQAIGE
jgi:hypothetical protein